jgi:ABC-2 type transport system ATP-binding protein
VLSSHILAEVEALCDRVSSIRGGRTVESATLASLRHLTCTSISAELKNPPAGVTAISGVHDLVVEGTRVRCTVDAERLDEVLRELTSSRRSEPAEPAADSRGAVHAPLRS